MAARREEDLGGGRASWLVPFDVISPYTYKQTATRKREKKHVGRGNVPPPPKGSPPPPERESNERRKEKKGRQKGREEERRKEEKKDIGERKK